MLNAALWFSTIVCMSGIAFLLINGALVTARMSKEDRQRRLDEFDDAW